MDINSVIRTIAKSKNISFEEAKIEFDKMWNKPIDEEKLNDLANKE